jgi:hypothetical protein
MRKLLLPLLLTFSFFIAQAYNCNCQPIPFEQQFAQSDLIFHGKVKDISLAPDHVNNIIKFDVRKVYKGGSNNLNNVLVSTPATQGSCGFSFEPGKSYIIFAMGSPHGLFTTSCTMTQFYTKQLANHLHAISGH